jgi:hypothetical protein
MREGMRAPRIEKFPSVSKEIFRRRTFASQKYELFFCLYSYGAREGVAILDASTASSARTQTLALAVLE